MSYKITISKKALIDRDELKKTGDKKMLLKLVSFIPELQNHPRIGTGQIERLKYQKEEIYSRRISREHRLVYSVNDEIMEVYIISLYGHYED